MRIERIQEQFAHPSVTFFFDECGAIRERLLHEGRYFGLALVLVALGISCGHLLATDRVDEIVVRVRRMQQLFGKAALGRIWFEIVFVLRKILSHGRKLSPYLIPVIQQNLGWAFRRLWRLILGVSGQGTP